MNLNADGTEDLEAKLSEIDISVPPRDEGRKTEDCERSSIARFLATLNRIGNLRFPIVVTKRERPDFSVELGVESWGVEITEAIPTSYAHAKAVAAKEYPDALIDISLFKYGEDKSIEEIREIVNASELTGDGWSGKGAEKELAEAIKQVVAFKTKKLRSESFARFSRNILLIYENMPLPKLHQGSAVELIAEALSEYWNEPETFDSLYVERGDEMLAFDAASKNVLAIPKLW